ncbi:MAG: type IV pilus modification protein PilV [Gammaproteobacteria bacterium]
MLTPTPRSRCQRGFSLLEVLVALVVLSIGLMGIASMQVVGLQFNQQALTSTRAIEMAADMADRIRASNDAGVVLDTALTNPAAVPVSSYETDFGVAAMPATACADTAGVSVPGIGTCNAATLAAYEVWQWKTALAAATGSGLADGDGSVTHDYDPARRLSTYVIDVRWSDRGEEAHYVLELRL